MVKMHYVPYIDYHFDKDVDPKKSYTLLSGLADLTAVKVYLSKINIDIENVMQLPDHAEFADYKSKIKPNKKLHNH